MFHPAQLTHERVDVNANDYSVKEDETLESKAMTFAARLTQYRAFWRCFDKWKNYIAVTDDFGNLAQVHNLGASSEW